MSDPATPQQGLTAILPCSDLDAAEAFFERLGFARRAGGPDEFRTLLDGLGGRLHLTRTVEDWLVPGRNPFGLYLYREDVDGLAAAFAGEILGPHQRPTDRSWNGPDDVLARTGWPTRLR